MGKKIILGMLAMIVVAVVVRSYFSNATQNNNVENRVIRLEKLPDNKIFKTSWNDQWIWVIPRSQALQGKLHKQGKIYQSLTGPKNVFRSLVPDFFVFSTGVSKEQQSLLAAVDDSVVLCEEFLLAQELGERVPDNSMIGCRASEAVTASENKAPPIIYYFDAVGQPVPNDSMSGVRLKLKPLEVPPQYLNSQRHLVVGRENKG